MLLTGYHVEHDPSGRQIDGDWIVKNSWGGDWGDDGYIRIAMELTPGEKGCCGINMQPSAPLGASMPPNYVQPKLCQAVAAGELHGAAGCEAPSTCCCAARGLFGCKDFECCSASQTCAKDKGCQ